MFPNRMSVAVFAVALFVGVAVSLVVSSSVEAQERKVPYTGPKLNSDTMMCRASHVAAAGFWSTDLAAGTVAEIARLYREPKTSVWRIKVSGDRGTAEVIHFNANLEAITPPDLFSAERTSSGGLLLVLRNRDPGTSTETISIDPTNSSFVSSSQHVNAFRNRATIWYGSCRPDE